MGNSIWSDETVCQHINFLNRFLNWYRDSYGKSEVENHLNLIEVVKYAEELWNRSKNELDGYIQKPSQAEIESRKETKRRKSLEYYYKKKERNSVKKKKVKRISRYL